MIKPFNTLELHKVAYAVQINHKVPTYAYDIEKIGTENIILSAYKLQGCFNFDYKETLNFFKSVVALNYFPVGFVTIKRVYVLDEFQCN